MTSTNDKVWIKYALGIQSWAGKDGQSDPNAVYYIASAANQGPAAGSFVPDANMNNALYEQCDALIANTSPVYNPGQAGSYFASVYKYLRAVKLKQNREQGLEQQLKEAKVKYDEADDEYYTAENKSYERWKNDRRSGEPAGTNFESWVTSNAPGLLQAQMEKSNRAETVAQLMLQIYGPDAQTLNSQKSAFIQADNKLTLAPGLNMQSSLDQISPTDYEKYYKAVQDGTVDKLPPLSTRATFFRPAYSIDPRYKTTMDEWARVPLDAKDEFVWNIKSTELNESSWTKLGHMDGNISFGYGFIRIGGGASRDWSDSEVTKESGTFEIELSAQRANLFNVSPGAWNVKQFRLTYPNTDGDVGIAKNAVQPTQLLCASRVKLRVKFTGEMEKAFDKTVQDVKSGNAGVSILGFKIGAGGGRTDKETTHTSNLVKEDGWYKIEPTLVNGGCSLLAVIGSNFDKQ